MRMWTATTSMIASPPRPTALLMPPTLRTAASRAAAGPGCSRRSSRKRALWGEKALVENMNQPQKSCPASGPPGDPQGVPTWRRRLSPFTWGTSRRTWRRARPAGSEAGLCIHRRPLSEMGTGTGAGGRDSVA